MAPYFEGDERTPNIYGEVPPLDRAERKSGTNGWKVIWKEK